MKNERHSLRRILAAHEHASKQASGRDETKMGIPYYFYVISRSTPGILLAECPAGCADYFLDYNGVIHQAVAEIMNELSALPANEIPAQDDPALEARMHKAIWDYTESCMRVIAPTQQVSICIDGVAPVAKMVQQRKRRYLSGLKYRLDGQPVPWDRNAISPGTPFMIRLHASLRAAIRNRDGRGGPYIYLSTSEDPGEGEHKIFQRIAGLSRAPVAGAAGRTSAPAPIVIHGLDADLIMLSLLSDTPGIYLMREPTHVVKPGDASAPGIPTLDPELTQFVYVSIDALRVALLADLSRTFRWKVDAAARADAYSPSACAVIRDYVALCFLLGNDFLPHPATLSLKHGGHDRLLHAARSATEATGLTMTGVAGGPAGAGAAIVNGHYVAHVLRELARDEDALLAEYVAKYLKRTPRPPPGGARFAPSEFYPLRPEHKDPCARALGDGGGALKPAWQSVYYQHLFHTRMHDTRTMTTACQLFAQGVQWTLSYYKRQPKDALWYYPFGFAPTFRDLANYVASRPDVLSPPSGGTGPGAATATGFVDAMVQLLCIMPPESADILPQHVRTLMTVPAHGCTHLFPRGYPIQTFLKTHLWECHPVLPALDIALMQRALAAVTSAGAATVNPKSASALARPPSPDRGAPRIPLRGPANVRYSSFGAAGRAAVGRFRSTPGMPAAIAAPAPATKAAPR